MLINNGFDSELDYLEFLEKVVEKAWTGIIVANKKGKYIYCNEAHQVLTGFNSKEMSKLTVKEVEKKFIFEKISSSAEVMNSGTEIIMEQKIVPTNIKLLVKAFPIMDDNNMPKYAVSSLLDVTKLQEIKEALHKERIEKEKTQLALKRVLNLFDDVSLDSKLVYKSKSMKELVKIINLVAESDATVLITGESGVGKELIARRLHENSHRKDNPYFAINCSAIPANLLESELFGYEPGTFSGGSSSGKIGILESAGDGTVLLDEIGDMPVNLQAKVLRTLEENQIVRLGGHKPINIKARFIAATNMNLEQLVIEEKFRKDLFYRINVIPIHVPPLRERNDDIPILVLYFVQCLNAKYDKKKVIENEAILSLMKKKFPGNIRQLKNLLERAFLMTEGNVLRNDLVNKLYSESDNFVEEDSFLDESDMVGEQPLKKLLEDYEKTILQKYTDKYKSTYIIAEKLGTNQSTISRKCNKYGIK